MGKKWTRLRIGLVMAVVVGFQAILARWVCKPLHLQGVGQPLTNSLNALDQVLQFPGHCWTYNLGLRKGLWHDRFGEWFLILAMNLAFYLLLGILIGRWREWKAQRRTPTREKPAADAPTRRRFLSAGLPLAGSFAAAGLGYGLFVEPGWFQVTRRTVAIHGLPSALDGLRLVQLTDIHHGPWLSLAYIRQVVQVTNELSSDLVLLTGDYVSESPVYIRPVVEELAGLQPRIATIAVLGNHDWEQSAEMVSRHLRAAGIALLDNGRRVLTPERQLLDQAAEGLALCGVADLWWGQPNYRRALDGLPSGMPRLLLSHNPDVAEEAALVHSGLRVDLIVSGHTHGGQIYLPGIGGTGCLSSTGQKYLRGLVQGPNCPVFISKGIGMSVLPLRLGSRPEIAVLELHASGKVSETTIMGVRAY